jgi:hypothetical protein
MSDAVTAGRGKYVATPISVTFPADHSDADLAGKTLTYAGRGKHPRWWKAAEAAGLVPAKEKTVVAETAATA